LQHNDGYWVVGSGTVLLVLMSTLLFFAGFFAHTLLHLCQHSH
jgi:hypothetical protein